MTEALLPGDRIYIAARFERQAEARAVADELVTAGYKVTSRWLLIPDLAVPENAAERAHMDMQDLTRSEVYLLLSDDVLGRGGKDFEGGVAWAWRRRVVVVGPRAHVFHYLPEIHHLRDLGELRARYLSKKK